MKTFKNPDFLTKRQALEQLGENGTPVMSMRTLERHLQRGNIKRSGREKSKVLIAWNDYLAFKNKLEQGLI